MATCKECVHYDFCASVESCAIRIILAGNKADERCKLFKPAADVVEVVRCKDCGMSRETEDEEYLFCMQFKDTVDKQAFCSYGERKENV